MIPLCDTVDQGSKLEVKMLSDAMLSEARGRYVSHERGDPPEDENPTKEQLTGLFAAVFTLLTSLLTSRCGFRIGNGWPRRDASRP